MTYERGFDPRLALYDGCLNSDALPSNVPDI